MSEKTRTHATVRLRKSPQQRRSAETVDVIVEAAARILETRGFEGFNTNAIAENAGVSIGSLYQYFPSKHALLSALIQREMTPLLKLDDELRETTDFNTALLLYIQASVRNQMRRPELARLLDLTERREIFDDQVSAIAARLLRSMETVLRLPNAPKLMKRSVVAADLIAIIKALTDAAGERSERGSQGLLNRISGAVMGYLNALPTNASDSSHHSESFGDSDPTSHGARD